MGTPPWSPVPAPTHLILALGVHQPRLQDVQGLAQDRGTPTLRGGAYHQWGCQAEYVGILTPPTDPPP